jgi:hypothetical protein
LLRRVGLVSCALKSPAIKPARENDDDSNDMLRLAASFCFSAWMAVAARPQLPLSFEPNQGQWDRETKFLARGLDYTLEFDTRGISLLRSHGTVRMDFEGARPAVRIRGRGSRDGKANYLIGHPTQWVTNVPLFGGIEYRGVYPGIDLLFYGSDEKLEYDFSVAPEPRCPPSGFHLPAPARSAWTMATWSLKLFWRISASTPSYLPAN